MIIDITGQKFGRLTVDGFAYTKNNRAYWNCTCDCGTHCVKMGKYLRNGDTKSCGCLNIDRVREMGISNVRRNKYEILEDKKTVRVYFNNTNNSFLCDIDDWVPLIDKYTWFESEAGYARTSIIYGGKRRFVFFHSYILGMPQDEGRLCDHINRNKLDNRRINLRIVTKLENNINQKRYKNNKSGHTGVYKNNNKWYAVINHNGEAIRCGCYDSYDDAVVAREKAEIEVFGFLKEDGIKIDVPLVV